MAKMKFEQDHFVNGTDEVRYKRGQVYNIPTESVERWLKRGGILVPDGTAEGPVIEAQLDASLAANLEKEGQGTHQETVDAVKHAEAVANGDEDEDSEEDDFETGDDEEHGKPASSKKKVSKKVSRR